MCLKTSCISSCQGDPAAREFGDLRENAEYKAAKERQSIVQARISCFSSG